VIAADSYQKRHSHRRQGRMASLRVAVLALCARGASAYLGTVDAPVACCFTLGFANNQVPCCFESQQVENKAGCTLQAPAGGTLGFNGTICPESADEAQCLVQFAVPPVNGKEGKDLAPGNLPPIGPECSGLYDTGVLAPLPEKEIDTEEGEQAAQQQSDEPEWPAPVKEGVKPLVSDKAVRLRSLQPRH
jgi:hypothetical protein